MVVDISTRRLDWPFAEFSVFFKFRYNRLQYTCRCRYKRLQDRYNRLQNRYNRLQDRYNRLQDMFNRLQDWYNRLQDM